MTNGSDLRVHFWSPADIIDVIANSSLCLVAVEHSASHPYALTRLTGLGLQASLSYPAFVELPQLSPKLWNKKQKLYLLPGLKSLC